MSCFLDLNVIQVWVHVIYFTYQFYVLHFVYIPFEYNPLFCSKDLANFHRPKALWYPHDHEVAVKEREKLPTVGPMKIILKSLGGKGSKVHVDAEETVSSVKAKASKKLGCIHFSGCDMPNLCFNFLYCESTFTMCYF